MRWRRRPPPPDALAQVRRLSADLAARLTAVTAVIDGFAADLDATVTRLQHITDTTERLACEHHDDDDRPHPRPRRRDTPGPS